MSILSRLLLALTILFSAIAPSTLSSKTIKLYILNEKPVLILYYTPSCPYSVKVLNYLKDKRKQVPMKNVSNNPQAKEELRKYGGKLQVPCLFIDGKPLYESNDIIYWLSQHLDVLDPA